MQSRRKAVLPPTDSAYGILGYELAPSREECQAMLEALCRFLGSYRQVAQVLTVPAISVQNWTVKRRQPCAGSRRAIWFAWAALLHPEKIKTAHDIATWGRLR